MTISQTLKFAIAKLTASDITDLPHLEAEILLSAILKKPREFLLAHGEKKLSKKQINNYLKLLARRLKGEPVAYLTGHKEFYGLDFIVNKNVLIPRPETELMVDEALNILKHNQQHATLIDVGTGSGCVIITLAKISKSKANNFIGIDISAKALTIAKKNAYAHGAKNIKFLHGNLLEPITKIRNQKFIILANLPYGWKAWKNNSSADTIGLKFEPEIALYTGKNGLELYEELFKQIKALQIAGYALCEFDPRQTVKMKQLIKRKLPRANCQIKKDLAGLNRLVIIEVA
ncbi:MAG: peptide chain release factor N(5)-glutamine methyltransferase [Patescibacteria group bacterium]|jgi:release factor glutamine methyltransferase